MLFTYSDKEIVKKFANLMYQDYNRRWGELWVVFSCNENLIKKKPDLVGGHEEKVG